MAMLCVLGLLTSLAVPIYNTWGQRRSRLEQLVASARACKAELPSWIESAPKAAPRTAGEVQRDPSEDADYLYQLELFVRSHNERFRVKGGIDEDERIVVEPVHMRPAGCERDGRIHLIPIVNSGNEFLGATLVVTEPIEGDGGGYEDGIVDVQKVWMRQD
jgi:hypothetical protein